MSFGIVFGICIVILLVSLLVLERKRFSKKIKAGLIAATIIASVLSGSIIYSPLPGAGEESWTVGIGGDLWSGNVTYDNTTEVQCTGSVELRQKVDDYVSYWRFDKGTGNTAYDQNETSNNDGSFTDGSTGNWTSSSRYGDYGIDFDGTADYIDCGNDLSLNISDAITIVAWIYPHDSGEGGFGRVFEKWYNVTYGPYGLYMGGTGNEEIKCRIQIGGVSKDAITTGNAVPYNQWSFVTGVYNGSNVIVYVNGVEYIGAAATGLIDSYPSADVTIGNQNPLGERTFNGTIDVVRIYNRALSNDEINQTMNNTHYTSGNCTSIIKDLGINRIAKQARVKGSNLRVGTNITVAVNVSEFNTSFTLETLGTVTTVGDFNVTYDITATNQKRYVGWEVYYQTNDTTNTSVLYNITVLYESNIAPELREVITIT